jgi:hypothetical protein
MTANCPLELHDTPHQRHTALAPDLVLVQAGHVGRECEAREPGEGRPDAVGSKPARLVVHLEERQPRHLEGGERVLRAGGQAGGRPGAGGRVAGAWGRRWGSSLSFQSPPGLLRAGCESG